jgi:hypothetical protein
MTASRRFALTYYSAIYPYFSWITFHNVTRSWFCGHAAAGDLPGKHHGFQSYANQKSLWQAGRAF